MRGGSFTLHLLGLKAIDTLSLLQQAVDMILTTANLIQNSVMMTLDASKWCHLWLRAFYFDRHLVPVGG